MSGRKILWGVCGIGSGHIFRQLPLIEYFAKDSEIVIFGYGESYRFYRDRFLGNRNVHVENVAVPFYAGNEYGVDFEATAKAVDSGVAHQYINARAMAQAQKIIGKPDLVISDYEPVSAQYAYAYNAPLVTLDQQSKYLDGSFPASLSAQCFEDEIMRLRMFFPKAVERLACSFFRVARNSEAVEHVRIMPPILGARITEIKRVPESHNKVILIYLSAQQEFGQDVEDIGEICKEFPNVEFNLFMKDQLRFSQGNLIVRPHGDGDFYDVLTRCYGLVTTAGHTLLSEAMYLNIPVYAMPLPVYEQQMNAYVIDKGGFGVSHSSLDREVLGRFIEKIPEFEKSIRDDSEILLRGTGQKAITDVLQRHLG